MMARFLSICLCLTFVSNLIAQNIDSPLSKFDESSFSDARKTSQRIVHPSNYQTLILNQDKLKLILSSVPLESNSGTIKSEPFEILLPDGKSERFHLVEYSMMEPALAAKYPSTKTYYGYGLNDRNKRIRLDWTVNGLNAMIHLPEGNAFLKPYAKGDTQHYISYYEKDLPRNSQPFECGTIDEKIEESMEYLESSRAGDCQLRTYRLAIAVTGEYATSTLGASVNGTAADDAIVNAHIVTSINQINGWYERDVTARFILIANLSDIFYYDGANDPYSNDDAIAMLGENVTNIDAVIGNANYDIGHVMGNSGGSSGVASLNSLCSASKARGVTRASAFGITQPRFLKVWAHEIGHQFGAGHTQGEECQRSSTSAMEPGAGTTLMSYVTSNCINQIQNVPDYYFHAISIQQMASRMLATTCAAIIPSSNTAPTVSAGPDVTVPHSTPLLLEATASDPENDPLTFTWEQFDNELAEAIPPQSTNLLGPNFRSFPPSTDIGRYLPNLPDVIAGATPTWEVLPSVQRTMEFRITARDNSTNSISCTDEDQMIITTAANGPFEVLSPSAAGTIWIEAEPATITWDVAGTDMAPVSCANVDILLSYDGGLTYPTTLASNVSNNGSTSITVPSGITTTARVQVRCSDNIFYNISASDFEIQLATGPTFLIDLPNPTTSICAGDIESNVSITSTVVAGFTGNIALTAINLPGSTTINFASSSIPAGSSTTFDIDNTSGLAEGSYTFSIQGSNGPIVRTKDYILTIEEPAGTTTLDLPSDNEVDVDILPILSWIPKSNAITYNVQVADDSNFSNLIVDETVTTTSYSVAMPLAGLTLHYWRVKALTGCGETPWSSTRDFTTVNCDASFIQNTPLAISSSGQPEINSVLTVTGPGTVDGLVISNIIGDHTFVGDLAVRLIAPGGSPVALLWDDVCGSFDDFNLSIDDNATDFVSAAPCSPLGQGGTYKPVDPLSVFNGLPIAGDWTLRINDNANQDGGQLTTWRLDFCQLQNLPVELMSFQAFEREEAIQLEWKTATENMNAGFEIERREENNTDFITIGEVKATEDLQSINYYEYLDRNVRPGIRYYYRLRQNDLNGQFEYSEIQSAKIKADNFGLQVYPNPVSGELFGLLNSKSSLETDLFFIDLNGRIISEQKIIGKEFRMDLTAIPAGIYILKARQNQGEQIVKLVVK